MDVGSVKVHARRGSAEPVAVEGGLQLTAESKWRLQGDPELLSDIALALPEAMVELLDGVLLLDFGNAVGTFRVPHLGRIEVVSGKWSQGDYEAMLADITETMAALPFSAADTAKLPYDRQLSRHRDVLYQAFVYLRHILSEDAPRHVRLRPALEAIVREPHFRLAATRRRVPLGQAADLDMAFVAKLAAGAEPVVSAPAHMRNLPIARALGWRLPIEVEERRPERIVDTAENRFAKNFLQVATAIIEQVETIATAGIDKKRFWRRVLDDCERMRATLSPYVSAPLWDEVGRMTLMPVGSSVLQRRRGYREVYQHFIKLRAATRLPLDDERLRDHLEIKDIAELYELWCYFRVVDALTDALNVRPSETDRFAHGQMHVQVPWDFRVQWPSGIECLYNLRFSKSRKPGQRSYSVPLRPDIVIRVPDGLGLPMAGLHILDAKFKMRDLGPLTDGEDDEGERRSTFKRGDLYKMHTYRDAIEGTRTVSILYPGSEGTFYPAGEGKADGVGAVPLFPGGAGALSTYVQALVRDIRDARGAGATAEAG